MFGAPLARIYCIYLRTKLFGVSWQQFDHRKVNIDLPNRYRSARSWFVTLKIMYWFIWFIYLHRNERLGLFAFMKWWIWINSERVSQRVTGCHQLRFFLPNTQTFSMSRFRHRVSKTLNQTSTLLTFINSVNLITVLLFHFFFHTFLESIRF